MILMVRRITRPLAQLKRGGSLRPRRRCLLAEHVRWTSGDDPYLQPHADRLERFADHAHATPFLTICAPYHGAARARRTD
jgi:hypothetical protein